MRTRGYLAFFVGVCLTASACYYVTEEQQKLQVRDSFKRDTEKVARDTQTRLQIYFDALNSLKGAYAVNEGMDRLHFHRFVGALKMAERYPGFQAMQFVRVVPAAQLSSFAETVRHDTSIEAGGYPDFHIHPVTLSAQHYIIEYTEPMKGNENAFGLDLAALPSHLRALELGRDSGEIVATEPITLVQDTAGQPGFVARAPLYRNGMPLQTTAQRREALTGYVAIVFRVNTLMREVIEPALLEHMHVHIEDGGLQNGREPAPGAPTLLFDSDGTVETNRQHGAVVPGLHARVVLPVGQRNWIMTLEGRAGARYSSSPLPVLLIAVVGVIISALIAALLVAYRRESDARHGLQASLTALELEKNKVEQTRNDLADVVATLKLAQTNLQTSEKLASLGALVAGVSHELNTPIGNSLLTATSLGDMVRDFERRLKEEGGLKRSALEAHLVDARKACDILAGSLTRAADLITSFKQVAVDQTSGHRRRFRLDEVLHDMLATYGAQLRRAACEVRVDVPADIVLDSYPGSLSQVFSNLLGNALLHGFDGRECGTIAIRAWRDGEDLVMMEFRDDGVGMSDAVLHKIFDPFFTTKMGQGGSGLGMNIVYNIVTNVLKGTIRVESSPRGGTCVTLALPVRPREDAQATA